MACREVQEWIEEKIEKPIDDWIEKRVKKCKKKKCKKWCLCCNKWFCWIETFLEKVIKWVIVTVGKWAIRVVCEIVHYILHVIGILIGLIDLLANILLGIPELILCLLGAKAGRRKISLCVAVIAKKDGSPVVPIPDVERHIQVAKKIYDRCGMDLDFGKPRVIKDRTYLLSFPGGPAGYFRPKLHNYQNVALKCWRFSNIIIPLPKLSAIYIESLGSGRGIHYPGTNFLLVDKDGADNSLAHEIGHACELFHRNNEPENLMAPGSIRTALGETAKLTKWQCCWIRRSRFATSVFGTAVKISLLGGVGFGTLLFI